VHQAAGLFGLAVQPFADAADFLHRLAIAGNGIGSLSHVRCGLFQRSGLGLGAVGQLRAVVHELLPHVAEHCGHAAHVGHDG